jgi:hypothetical protein
VADEGECGLVDGFFGEGCSGSAEVGGEHVVLMVVFGCGVGEEFVVLRQWHDPIGHVGISIDIVIGMFIYMFICMSLGSIVLLEDLFVALDVSGGTELILEEDGGFLAGGGSGGGKASEVEKAKDSGFGLGIVPLDVPVDVEGLLR